MNIEERYHAVALAANSSFTTVSQDVYGFLAVTAGTITITRVDGAVILNAFPVTAGQVVNLNMFCGTGAIVQLAGGASGTLLK